MNVELIEARADEIPVLRRLLQLYLYDLATIDEWDVHDDGLFGNPNTIARFRSPTEERRSAPRPQPYPRPGPRPLPGPQTPGGGT
jgi:hypothetical protein